MQRFRGSYIQGSRTFLLLLFLLVFSNQIFCLPDVSNCRVVNDNGYIQGTTCILWFTFSGITQFVDNWDIEWGDSLAIEFPEGIVPTGYAKDPFSIANNGQEAEALNGVDGRTISWGDNDNSFGGIEPGNHRFFVEVAVAEWVSGDQTAIFYISGDEYGSEPHEYTGEISLHEISTCEPSTGLSAYTLDANTTEIRWTYGSTANCIIEWGESGFEPGNGTLIPDATNPDTLTGLDPKKVYDLYLKDACGPELVGEWQGPFSFSTMFSRLEVSFPNNTYGFASWGDMDNDGDRDLIFLGENAASIYRNDGTNIFTEVPLGIPMLRMGTGALADYDNDGDIDFIHTGWDFDVDGPVSLLYRNEGSLVFTELNAGLTGVYSSTVDWGDVNNDGWSDLVMGGWNSEDKEEAMIYLNNRDGSFGLTDIEIRGCEAGSLEFIDYNNDNYADILRTGIDNIGNKSTILYTNNGDMTFEENGNMFYEAVYYSSCWEDLDNNGYADHILCGFTSETGSVSTIYYNNGNGTFIEKETEFAHIRIRGVGAADLNNDGYSDICLMGNVGGSFVTKVYLNNGDRSFTDIHASMTGNAYTYNIEAGDYDNDGDLDLLVPGPYAPTAVYINNHVTPNTPPSVPDGLQNKEIAYGARLTWNSSVDAETPEAALSYNLRIGTSPDSFNIMSPVADTLSGYRRITNIGNGWLDTSYVVQNLDTGMYYWGVQAIDNGGMASEFSAIDSFYVMSYFSEIFNGNGMDSVSYAVWGDYDNDGDLDLATTGKGINYAYVSKIFKNMGNDVFTEVLFCNDSVEGICRWGDYDNDGDLDLFLAGQKEVNGQRLVYSKIYRNDGEDLFTDIEANIPELYIPSGLYYPRMKWGDLDNDGDLDIIVSGEIIKDGNYYPMIGIFRNDGGDIFTPVNTGIQDMMATSISLADVDGDGRKDLLLSGRDTNSELATSLYRNNGNFDFTETNTGFFPGLYDGASDWADYDGDGDPDLAICGADKISNHLTAVFRNNGDGSFTQIEQEFEGARDGSILWADYDNDGDHDLVVTGRNRSFVKTIYINLGDDNFRALEPFPVSQFIYTADWGDYDNDGDLDLFTPSLIDVSDGLFRNNIYTANTPPQAPENLRVTFDGSDVMFHWDRSFDAESDSMGLTYNLRIGTTPGGSDILAPMSDTLTGFRSIPTGGNAGPHLSSLLCDLPIGNYYWSVQAIDPGFSGGPWAEELSFEVSVLRAEFDTDTACFGTPTSFTDRSYTSGAPLTEWWWDFGDGSGASVPNPQHTFDSPGLHTVKLRVTTTEAEDSLSMDILVLDRPTAGFQAEAVCQGEQTNYVNTTDNRGLTVTTWQWDFGDGNLSDLENPPAHGYLLPGSYATRLVVQSMNGCTDSITKTVQVGHIPVAAITLSSSPTFCSGDSVILSSPHNDQYSYVWNLGGNSLTASDTSRYIVKGTGTYTVEVTNPIGQCVSVSEPVEVQAHPKPAAPFIIASGPVSFCQGDSVTLTVNDDPALTYQWMLNGGSVGTDLHTHTTMSPGNYSVEVINESGCAEISSNSVTVSVRDNPSVPDITLSGARTFCEGDTLTLTIDDPGTESYQWMNTEGAITGQTGSSLEITSTGEYYLRVRNEHLCEINSTPVSVTVNPYPVKPVIQTENYTLDGCKEIEPVILRLSTTQAGVDYQWIRNGVAITGATGSSYEGFLEEGDYAVEGSSNGCAIESDALTIRYADMPEKPEIIAEGPVVWYLACSNDSATAYTWYLNDKEISGANEAIYVAGEEMGKYEVSVSVNNSCYSISDPLWIPLGTGMEESPFSNLKIYPNPTPGMFTLEMNNPLTGELIIDIFGETGKMVLNIKFHKETSHFKTQIDLSGQPPAMYLIGLMLEEYQTTRSLIVE